MEGQLVVAVVLTFTLVDPEAMTLDEVRELDNILVQASKNRLADTWKSEESKASISPIDFWRAEREPVEGAWPPIIAGDVPLVDPDEIRLDELPVRDTGQLARDYWRERRARLDAFLVDQRTTRLENGVLSCLLLAFEGIFVPQAGETKEDAMLTGLSRLKTKLHDQNEAVVQAARECMNTF